MLLIAAAWTAGCADTARQIARNATPGGIDGGLEALSRPENQRRLAILLDQPALEQAGRRLSRGAVAGIQESLDLEALPDGAFRNSEFRGGATRPAATQSIRAQISPADENAPTATRPASTVPAGAISRTVRATELWAYGMIRSATSDGIRDAMSEPGPALDTLTDHVVDSGLKHLSTNGPDSIGPLVQSVIVDNIGPGVGEAIRKDLGPAIHDMVRQDLAPALRDMIRQELRPAMGLGTGDDLQAHVEKIAGGTSRVVSREALLGADDALRQLDEAARQGKPVSTLLGHTQGTIQSGLDLARVAAIALALLVMVLATWLAIILAKTRRARAEAVRREASSRRLAEAVRAAADRPWSGELRSLLKERLGSAEDVDEVFGKAP
jgi:hypothetical protein